MWWSVREFPSMQHSQRGNNRYLVALTNAHQCNTQASDQQISSYCKSEASQQEDSDAIVAQWRDDSSITRLTLSLTSTIATE